MVLKCNWLRCITNYHQAANELLKGLHREDIVVKKDDTINWQM